MQVFKVGQKIRYKPAYAHEAPREFASTHIHTVLAVDSDGDAYILNGKGEGARYGDYRWVVISSRDTVDILDDLSEVVTETIKMSIVSKFRMLMTSEPEKTFIETGIMNDKQELTSEGKELFIAFMFEKHKEEFKTEVADKLKEVKE